MLRWLLTCAVIVTFAVGGFYLLVGVPQPVDPSAPPPDAPQSKGSKPPANKTLQAAEAHAAEAVVPPDRGATLPTPTVGAVPLIVIPEGRVNAIDKQEVPSQHDGQLLFVGAEVSREQAGKLSPERAKDLIKARLASVWVQLNPGEKEQMRIPAADLRVLRVEAPPRDYRETADSQGNVTGMEDREFRRLRDDEPVPIGLAGFDPSRIQIVYEDRLFQRLQEGDEVTEGQLLGMVNPALISDEVGIKLAKLKASQADYDTAIKTRDEAKARFDTSFKLWSLKGGVESEESMRGAKLTWQRYIYEVISKKQAIHVAAAEMKQSQTTLEMHTLRSKIPGRIKTVYKNKGDAVKNLDPVLQVFDPNKLRIEGLIEMQNVGLIKEGDPVFVEPTRFARHEKLLRGHLHAITGVAVSKKLDIVSSSEDRTVRVWSRSGDKEKMILQHGVPVKAVACTPADAQANLCLTGATDGVGRLWDLDAAGANPAELRGGHTGAINCVAFGPGGKWCATGGEDRAICLWDTATGKQLQRFVGGQRSSSASANGNGPAGHRGAVTSLAFLSETRLVSAGADQTLLVWTLKRDDGAAQGPPLVIDRRSGDVATLGVSPDDQAVLFDYGRELRVLTVPKQETIGVLQTASGATNFTTMAQFSPDGKLILTAGGSEGRLQLWRAPTAKRRAYEQCQLISPATATCGAFAPDGSFLVTGTKDRQVLVWKAPTKEELTELTATVKFVEKALDSNSRQVRIWADLKEPQGLVPGSTATLVVYP
jgi:WD40 repeat protein